MAKRSILVVEDDLSFREMLERVLADAGYEVTTAVNGKEALKVLGTQGFSLVLTDLIMPEKDGTEVIMELRKKLPAIPVVAMSGGGIMRRDQYLQLAKMFGAHAILEKPFSKDQLISTLDVLLPAEPAG